MHIVLARNATAARTAVGPIRIVAMLVESALDALMVGPADKAAAILIAATHGISDEHAVAADAFGRVPRIQVPGGYADVLLALSAGAAIIIFHALAVVADFAVERTALGTDALLADAGA